MTERRPIDAQRDSAKFGVIGVDGDDSAISEMIPIGYTLYMVKGRGIYGLQLADKIDPPPNKRGHSGYSTEDSFDRIR
jgi:hypothetical protein